MLVIRWLVHSRQCMYITDILLKTPLLIYFNFFPKSFFQNLSSQTWGAAYLQVQLIRRCLRYILKWNSTNLYVQNVHVVATAYLVRTCVLLFWLSPFGVSQNSIYHFFLLLPSSHLIVSVWKKIASVHLFNLTVQKRNIRSAVRLNCSKKICIRSSIQLIRSERLV